MCRALPGTTGAAVYGSSGRRLVAIFWGATLVLSGIAWVLLLTLLPRHALAAILGVGLVLLAVP